VVSACESDPLRPIISGLIRGRYIGSVMSGKGVVKPGATTTLGASSPVFASVFAFRVLCELRFCRMFLFAYNLINDFAHIQ
jgi:hypothetical protein